jgi:hypothetical protein
LSEECRYGGADSLFPAEPVGHQIVGTLLAFLVVFRSQIALNMYLEGRGHLGKIMATSKKLAMEIIAPLAYGSVIPIHCRPPLASISAHHRPKATAT